MFCYFVMFPLSIKIGKTVPIAFAAGSSFQGRVLRVPAARTLSEFIIQQVSVEGTPPALITPWGAISCRLDISGRAKLCPNPKNALSSKNPWMHAGRSTKSETEYTHT